ncbi:MAG TPA: metal-binding protein [Blastocatellia bacterium]|nr:metal-binding protein [Blastocatellia bacterium]
MPNARTHDAITYAIIPFTFLGAEMYWGDHATSAIATVAMLFSGLMFGPDLDLDSKPYRRWGPLKFLWKPYQAALPHRSKLSHGPLLGTIIRIVYFLIVFSLFTATVLYIRHRYVNAAQTTWQAEFDVVKSDLFSVLSGTDEKYLWGAFGGLWAGALAHTTADIVWSALKRRRTARPERRERRRRK